MPTVRIQEKNYSESIMVLKLKDGYTSFFFRFSCTKSCTLNPASLCLIRFHAMIIIPDFQS